MIDWGGKVAVWFAGVAAASAALAALIAAAVKHPIHGRLHAAFVILVVIAGVAFLALLLTGPRALWAAWRSRQRDIISLDPVGLSTADPGHAPGVSSATLAASATTAEPDALPAPPVNVRLKPELDTATNRLRLGVLNRGELGRFRAEVIDTYDQDGNWVGPRSWPVPWLVDGSVTAREIPEFGKPLLDFAQLDFLRLREDLEGTKWLNGNHWVFPSLPQPIKVGYSPVRRWSDLENQHFVVTVRVIRDDPVGYVDARFEVGNDGTRPDCRELIERPASGTPLPADLRQLRDFAADGRVKQPTAAGSESAPVLEPETPALAVTDCWYQTSDGGKVPALMNLTHTGMSHPGYAGRQSQETPPSVKIGMLVACQPSDPASSGTELRAKFLDFLNSAAVRALVGALTDVQPGMSWKNLAGHGLRTLEAALTAGQDALQGVPAASALFLPPTAGESLYGRDGRSATLILYVEPQTADGRPPPPTDLACWSERFSLALAIPGAFADFLDKKLGLATSNEPPAQLGVWLKSYQSLTVMVDVAGLRMLAGSSPSNQFIGWVFADAGGKPIARAARDLIVQMCEYTLHLDDFESALAKSRA